MSRIAFSLCTLAALLWLLVAPAAHAGPPTEQIEATVRRVISILEDPALKSSQANRREKLRGVIYDRFDFTRMSQGTLGHQWRKFSPAQQERFISLFKQLLENTYVDKIENYQGESWTFTKEVRRTDRIYQVESVVHSKGQDYELSYQMLAVGGEWKVFDVIIEGVSLVNNYRSQFNQILSNSTVDELLAKLEEKVRKREKDLVPQGRG